jgi:hypothetical protein
MKHGILYFLYLGRLSWLARILLLPGIFWLTRVPPLFEAKFNPGFAFAIAVDLTLLILSMLPAPSDKYARKVIARYEEEFDAYIHDTYRGRIRFDNIRIMKTWQPCRRGFLNLEIKLDGEMITPKLTLIAMMEGKDEVIFECATYTLFGEDRLERKVWTVTASDSFRIDLIKHNESDVKVDVVFPAYQGLEQECFIITENYHLREFLAPLHALIPQDQAVKEFVGGGMLKVRR